MILYHYASNETLLSIIQNKKIYLSDLSLSNDTTEGAHTFDLIKEIFEEEEVWDPKGFNINHFGEHSTVLGFCLSTEGDMLSQWRAYAQDGKGVSIGFDKDTLLKFNSEIDPTERIFKLVEIQYDRDKQKQKLKEKLASGISEFKKRNPKLDLSKTAPEYKQEGKRALEVIVDEYLKMIFPGILDLYCFKKDFFKEEKEWRLMQNVTHGSFSVETEHIGFRAKSNALIPYRRFPDGQLSSNAISEIIMGPKNETPEYILEALLKNNNFNNCVIKRSRGTYK